MKRIGIIQIWQESNSFNPVLTTVEDFETFAMGFGKKGLEDFGKGEEVAGFVEGLNGWDQPVEAVGLVFAQAWPSGPITKETKKFFADAICEQLTQAGELDAVLFSLHGALTGEDEDDVDGFLLEQVRGVLGPEIAIVATIDLHAHFTVRMGQLADVLVAYHTSPHIDRFQTGQRAADVLQRILCGAKPRLSFVRLPLLITGELTSTVSDELGPVFERVVELESEPEILSTAILMCQPWIDNPESGWTVLVYTDGQSELAEKLAGELAQMCWQKHSQLTIDFLDARESIKQALACEGEPIIVADGADATNSGACGDSTHLLAEMIKQPVEGGALTIMVDPQAVDHAGNIGVGGNFNFAVGGKRDNIFSKPLNVNGKVLSLQQAKYILSGHIGDNLAIDMGNSAVVAIGDVTLLLVEKTGPGSSPTMYRCVGLEPKNYKIVVVKSPAGFRADFEPFAAGIVLSACPGCASPRLPEMPYKRISRPVWPLDKIDDWRDVGWVKKFNAAGME